MTERAQSTDQDSSDHRPRAAREQTVQAGPVAMPGRNGAAAGVGLAAAAGGPVAERHVLSLQKGAGNAAVSQLMRSRGRRTLQRWTKLGMVSWDLYWGSDLTRGPRVDVWTGTKANWSSVLGNMDDEDEYDENLKGFFWVANDPRFVGTRQSVPEEVHGTWRTANYSSTVTRDVSRGEKLAFLEALFEKGGDLDLWHGGALEGGPWLHGADRMLSEFIRNNQSLYLEAMAQRGQGIPSANIRAVADQGGRAATMAIILNAGASAFKGLDLAAAGTTHGYQLIQNSGHAIRYALQEHDARVAFEKKVAGVIFDSVWSIIPGGGTITNIGKDLLKTALKEGLDQAMSQGGPGAQAEAILLKFIEGANRLRDDGQITNENARIAINSFESAMR